MQSFQKGDTVRLKSGGPVMTVQDIKPDYVTNVDCSWFVGDTLKTGVFPSDLLRKVDPNAIFQAKVRR